MATFNIFLARHRSVKRNANMKLLCILVSVLFRFFKHLLYKNSYLNTLLIPSPITDEGEENGENNNKLPKINFTSNRRRCYRAWKCCAQESFFWSNFIMCQSISVRMLYRILLLSAYLLSTEKKAGNFIFPEFLGEFAKLWKATVSFVMSVRLSVWKSSASTRRIFMKFDIWGGGRGVSKIRPENFKLR